MEEQLVEVIRLCVRGQILDCYAHLSEEEKECKYLDEFRWAVEFASECDWLAVYGPYGLTSENINRVKALVIAHE